MPPLIDIKITGVNSLSVWFKVKGKYLVRIDKKTSEGSCSCPGDLFLKGGRKQKECKHIAVARKLFKSIWGEKR